MSPVEWYYAKDKRRLGPVTSIELKQLADQNFLAPDDLIWREGMDDWLPASNVKGLFEQLEPSELTQTSSSEEPDRPLPEPTDPSLDSPEAPVEPMDESEPGSSDTRADDMPVRAPPAPPSPSEAMGPAADTVSTGPKEPIEEAPVVFEQLSMAFEHTVQRSPGNPVDFLLDSARRQFTGHFVHSTATIFAVGGHYGLYAAMVASLITAVVLGLAAESLAISLVLAAFGVMVLFLLQYVAARFLEAVQGLDSVTSGRMASTALFDCFALFMTFLGAVGLITLALAAMASGQFLLLLPAVGAFIFCQYVAVIALNPESLNFTISTKVAAGEEALGAFLFLLKIALRLTPVAFGTGVVLATLALGFAGVQAAGWPDQLSIVLLTLPTVIMALFASAILPVVSYFLFLICHLLVDLAGAILSLKT